MNDPDTDPPHLHDARSYVVDGPDDTDQPCPHGDYRSCVIDGCRPLRRIHVAGVIVPPAPRVACMWCGEDSTRGQCGPCAALLDAIHAAPRAGTAAIVDAVRAEWRLQSPSSAQMLAPEVLRGFRALACALTAPQAEHPDVRAACEWLAADSGDPTQPVGAVHAERQPASAVGGDHKRATLELAVDDALLHERSTMHVVTRK